MAAPGQSIRFAGNEAEVTMSGGRALAEMLKLHGAGPMYGMGGFQLLPFYDAVRELGLVHHLINDERTGAFAADSGARLSGRPGVCDATLGPGATNLVTGLVESLNAGVPLIAIVGDTNRDHSGKNMTQEGDQVSILRPAVKEVLRLETAERIPEFVRRAYAIATSGRPGPVVINVPENVCHAEFTYDADGLYADPQTVVAPARRSRPADADIAAAATLLADAERPLILAGGGVHLSDASAALTAFAETLAVPVAHTMSGKGGIACTHPLSAGLFGRYSRIANDLITAADCLLVVGCKLGEIATRRYALLPPEVPLIHLDIDAEEFGRTTKPTVALWGDAREGFDALRDALSDGAGRARTARATYGTEVGERMAAWRQESASRLTSDEVPINVARLVEELNRTMPADSVLVADGGFAGHWTGLLYDTKTAGRTYIADRGFASIGYGLPGALGAQLTMPDVPVVAMTGDGGLNMTIGDLETARRAGAAFTLVVVNNAASGYVKALQHVMFDGRYQSSDLAETDYAAVARAMGCHGIRVERPEDLADALTDGMAERFLPTVIDVVVTRDPAQMLPAVDSRAVKIKKGDRPA